MRAVAMTLVLTAALGSGARAVERGVLPRVDLMDASGTVMSTDRLARTGTWVLVYVRAGCSSCESVLAALDGLDTSDGAARVTVVAEVADATALSGLMGRLTRPTGAQWLADPSGAMRDKVAPQAVATVLGLRGSTVEWSVVGVVTEREQVRTLVTTWLNR